MSLTFPVNKFKFLHQTRPLVKSQCRS